MWVLFPSYDHCWLAGALKLQFSAVTLLPEPWLCRQTPASQKRSAIGVVSAATVFVVPSPPSEGTPPHETVLIAVAIATRKQDFVNISFGPLSALSAVRVKLRTLAKRIVSDMSYENTKSVKPKCAWT